jgi:outer membrane immunogenic protein
MPIAKERFLILAVGSLLFLLAPAGLSAQMNSQMGSHLEFGADYNWLHSNAPAGECGCFSAVGADVWAGWRYKPTLTLLAQGSAANASNVNDTHAGLHMYSFFAGPSLVVNSRRRLAPFVKALAGMSHGSGELTPQSDGAAASQNTFALSAGGGADFALLPQLSVRLIDAEYLYTRFNNGTNDHQNNLSLAAGFVIRLGNR